MKSAGRRGNIGPSAGLVILERIHTLCKLRVCTYLFYNIDMFNDMFNASICKNQVIYLKFPSSEDILYNIFMYGQYTLQNRHHSKIKCHDDD